MGILTGLLGSLGGKVVDAVSARGERKHTEKVRALELDHAKHKIKLDSGWKDEFVLLLISIPMVLSFIPATVTYVENGFKALALTPDWYQWLILSIFAAVYGIRVWRRK